MKKLFKIMVGLFLILLGIFSAVFSTYATLVPIVMSFTDYIRIIMIGIFVIIQISVFFLSMTKNYIAREAPQHYVLINRLANILMFVSIISTMTFFTNNAQTVLEHEKALSEIYRVIPGLKILPFYDWILDISVNVIFIWSVCIILDILAIKSPLIGFDIMFGIKEKHHQITITSMIFAILTYKPKLFIETKYNELGFNLEEPKKLGEKPKNQKPNLEKPKLLLLENPNLKKFENYLSKLSVGDNLKSGKIMEELKITRFEYRNLIPELVKRNLIEKKNDRTYIVKEKIYDEKISNT